ncbi:hypothetical protein UFOVP264_37 [uncultured Caudovirales phage]|uniref:Uncharacterized protein n=1 Tax=uncultured Caudovirales phage TaxID=2100421 RepID=A0A6J5LL24_9CAUD|nr:hypothetical protein UFOVP264_37 [uncultured Caudovirales phage]
MQKIVWELPIKTCDETNAYEPPYSKTRRRKQQQHFIRLLFNREARPVPMPCLVTFVRLGPKEMDADDNLRTTMKFLKDGLAGCLFPEKALTYRTKKGKIYQNLGRCDDDPRVKWQYRQEKATRLGVRIEIEPLQ